MLDLIAKLAALANACLKPSVLHSDSGSSVGPACHPWPSPSFPLDTLGLLQPSTESRRLIVLGGNADTVLDLNTHEPVLLLRLSPDDWRSTFNKETMQRLSAGAIKSRPMSPIQPVVYLKRLPSSSLYTTTSFGEGISGRAGDADNGTSSSRLSPLVGTVFEVRCSGVGFGEGPSVARLQRLSDDCRAAHCPRHHAHHVHMGVFSVTSATEQASISASLDSAQRPFAVASGDDRYGCYTIYLLPGGRKAEEDRDARRGVSDDGSCADSTIDQRSEGSHLFNRHSMSEEFVTHLWTGLAHTLRGKAVVAATAVRRPVGVEGYCYEVTVMPRMDAMLVTAVIRALDATRHEAQQALAAGAATAVAGLPGRRCFALRKAMSKQASRD